MLDYRSLPLPADDEVLTVVLRHLGYSVRTSPVDGISRAHFVHRYSTVGTPDRQSPTTPSLTMADLRLYLTNARTIGDLQAALAVRFVAPKGEPDTESLRALLSPRAEQGDA